jgi:hypothetical protein
VLISHAWIRLSNDDVLLCVGLNCSHPSGLKKNDDSDSWNNSTQLPISSKFYGKGDESYNALLNTTDC